MHTLHDYQLNQQPILTIRQFGCKFIYDREHRAMIIVYCPRLSCVSAPLSEDILSGWINVAHTRECIYQSRSVAEQRGQWEDFVSGF